jgi:hypothetical protein
MTDRAICERIVEYSRCTGIGIPCRECPIFNDERGGCSNGKDLKRAKQWLEANPEPLSDIPNWDDLPWYIDNGGTKCKCLYKNKNSYGIMYADGERDVVEYIKPYIKTITMEIPADKVDAVKEVIK